MDEIYSGLGQYAYIAALFVPVIVGLLVKAQWPSWGKFIVTIVLSIIIGAVTIWQTNGSWEWSVAFILSLLGTSELVYRVILKQIPGLTEWLASHGIA
jgi:hypothetical protein